MPTTLSEIRKNYRLMSLNIYLLGGQTNTTEKFDELNKALDGLYALSDNFLTPNENGEYMIPDEGSLKLLRDAYIRCKKAASELFEDENYKWLDNKKYKDKADAIKHLVYDALNKDYAAIDFANASDKLTLPEIIEKGRSTFVQADYNALKSHKTGDNIYLSVNKLDDTKSDGVFIETVHKETTEELNESKPLTPLSKRMLAYSRIAKFLIPDADKTGLVFDATPMAITAGDADKKNSKNISGVLITSAPGENASNPNSKIYSVDKTAFNNPLVLRDISNLQILNLLTGNLDSVLSDINMNFTNINGKETLSAISVTGIGGAFNSEDVYLYTTDVDDYIEHMRVIDKNTADIIMNLEKSTLSTILSDCGLSQELIDDTWSNIEDLKSKLEESLEYYKDVKVGVLEDDIPRIIPSEDWNKYSFEQISYGKNIFHEIELASQNKEDYVIEEQTQKNSVKITAKAIELPKHKAEAIDKPTGINPYDPPLIKVTAGEGFDFDESIGNCSTRVPISFVRNGKTVTGFFTRHTHVNDYEEARKLFDNYIKAHPEWKDDFNQIFDYISQDLSYFYNDSKDTIELTDAGITKSRADFLNSNEEFNSVLKKLLAETKDKIQIALIAQVEHLGMDKDSLLDTRSITFYKGSMATGGANVIAPTTNMQVMKGDKIYDGIFMETALGVTTLDLSSVPLKRDVFDGEALKDLSDIQINDYLSSNADRNSNNFICVFSEGPDPKCIHFIAIDNDQSYGTVLKSVAYKPDISDIPFVSEERAQKILNTDPEAYRSSIDKDGLTEKEIDVALDRFAILKNAIEKGEIKTIKKDEWKNITLNDAVTTANSNRWTNIYYLIKSEYDENFLLGDKLNKTGDIEEREYNYQKTEYVEEFPVEIAMKQETANKEEVVLYHLSDDINEALDNDKDLSAKMREGIKKQFDDLTGALSLIYTADSKFIRSSKQYRDMKSIANETLPVLKQLTKALTDGNTLSPELLDMLALQIDKLGKAATMYRSYKYDDLNGKKPNDYEKGRIEAASKVALVAYNYANNSLYNDKFINAFLNPKKTVYENIAVLAESMNREGVGEDEFKKSLAGVIYMNALKKNMLKIKSSGNLKNVLSADSIIDNVDKIIETRGFADLFGAMSVDKMKNSVLNNEGDTIFKEYIKAEAKYVTKEDQNDMKRVTKSVTRPHKGINQPVKK